MGLLRRLRESLKPATGEDGAPARLNLAAEIPAADGGKPLWRIELQMIREPQADGDKLRLRARIQSNFGSVLSAHSPHPPAAALPPPGSSLPQRAGALAQRAATRVLALPVVGALAAPLLRHDFNTWVDVQASTATLDGGARELLPSPEQLARLGIRIEDAPPGPVQSWVGESPGGLAQVALMQMDATQLPSALRERLKGRPFHLAAAVVNTVEQP